MTYHCIITLIEDISYMAYFSELLDIVCDDFIYIVLLPLVIIFDLLLSPFYIIAFIIWKLSDKE